MTSLERPGISVLIVDDDRTIRETLAEFFQHLGYASRQAASAAEGRATTAAHTPDIVLLDLRLPDASGLTLLDELRADDPELGVIMLTGHADVPTAVRAMQQGALDFLEKPVDLEALDAVVRRAAELVLLRREVKYRRGQVPRSASSDTPQHVPPSLERLIELAAGNDEVPVLIVGEAGTGKGFVARRIHDRSVRASQPFIEVDGASSSATLLESKLFGHERNAFADAKTPRRGLLELAGRGTVFLDEVGQLATEVQPKLLEVLDNHTFRRLGGNTELRSDARVLAATNRPLSDFVRDGRFRADLFYRLQVLTLTLPPLRERRAELPDMATSFLPSGARFGPGALAAIESYNWPGNVRELQNTLWRAVLLAEGAAIEPRHLGLPRVADGVADGPVTLADAERRTIADALASTGGNKAQAAQVLRIARSTLMEKLKRYDIN